MSNFFETNFNLIYNDSIISTEIFIYEIGFENCISTKSMEYQLIDYYLIHYCIKGEGTLILDDKVRYIREGDLFLIPPNTSNRYMPNSENPWSYCWIGINGTMCDKFLYNCGFNKDNFIKSFRDTPLISFFEEIYTSCLEKNGFKILSSLYSFLGCLDLKKDEFIKNRISTGELYLNSILSFIHTNYSNSITIFQISKNVNLDRTYIFKLFKKYLNTSPSKYILNYRISKSIILIKRTTLSIQIISIRVGFKNYPYFSKEFKKKIGISPSMYRKNYM